MPTEPTPAEFFTAFEKVATSDQALVECWRRRPNYTSEMRSRIFDPVAKQLGLLCYAADYWTLDAVFYRKKDKKNFPHATYATYISVALEHENDWRGAHAEMNKLQLFNAPLKVLITYPTDPEHGRRLLDTYAEIVSQADVFGDISTLRRQLVIFGSLHGNATKWDAFVYENGHFTSLHQAMEEHARPYFTATSLSEASVRPPLFWAWMVCAFSVS